MNIMKAEDMRSESDSNILEGEIVMSWKVNW